MAIVFRLIILLCLILTAWGSPRVLASDLTIPQSTLYPYQSSIAVQDDFLSGINTNGTVGTLGWTVNTGTTTNLASSGIRLGIVRKDTTAVINTLATIALYGSSTAIDPTLPHRVIWIASLLTNDANTTVRIGELNSTAANPPNHGIYFEKLDADTNWFCVTRAAGVETRTDSTVAVTTNYVTFMLTRNSSGVQFTINSVNVCGAPTTTNIPTTFINPGSHINNSAAAAKQINYDYFQLKVTGLTR